MVCRVERRPGLFALTFDDGPSAKTTPRILDRLAHYGAHATFFMLAGSVLRYPEIVRRMVAEGHEPAIHGEMHLPLPLLPPALVRRQLERTTFAILDVSGFRPQHYRPPFGLMLPSQSRLVRRLGYRPVLGDIYPEDPRRPGVRRIVERVMRRLRAGSILILHDGSPLGDVDRTQTLEALNIILEQAAELGFTAVAVRDLLDAPCLDPASPEAS
jgi:peptidoglycan/xylan/chitin deacetylase (PgdA/CDA1 family)